MYKVAKFEKISEERYNEFRKNVVELDVINYEDIKDKLPKSEMEINQEAEKLLEGTN